MKTNWQIKRLGDLLDLCDAGTWGDEDLKGLPLLRSTNMQNGNLVLDDLKIITLSQEKINQYTLIEGDILMTKSSGSVDHIGKSLFISSEISGKYGFSNFTQRLRPNKSLVLPMWIYYRVSDPATREFLLGASSTTTGLRNLKISELKKLEIPLPPLEEQKRIVTVLDKKLGKIAEAKKIREEALIDTEKILSQTLSEIFEEGKKKGWEEKGFDDSSILKMTSGGTPNRANPKFYKGIIPWLKSGELQDNTNITDSEEKISEEAIEKSSAKVFPVGTVLFAMYGATAGKIGILGIEASTNQAVAGMMPVEEKLNNKFLYYFLIKKREDIITQAWGGAQPNLSQTILKTFSIPLPPLNEQKEIVKKLDELSARALQLRELQKEQLSDLKKLEKSLLREAFNGEL